MSYLDAVRLHFSGQFQADPSTVNNVPQYYDNEHFEKQYQQRPQGLWNPEGSGAWRLVDCRVTRVCYADGTSATDPRVDPVVGMRIMDANTRVSGKLVDLDPQQQMVSQIWGMIVRLSDGTTDYFSGPFEPAAFSDLWQRAMVAGRPRQQPLGAFYQSVLAPVAWSGDAGSRFLAELRAAATGGMLSIKFNVDGYDTNFISPQFTLGRITGTIGPAYADEPHHFVLGRHLGGTDSHMNFMPCVVDTQAKTLTCDFGNAIATTTPGGPLMNIGDMAVGWVDPASQRFMQIGVVAYRDTGWYESTAGVQVFPLTDAMISAIANLSVVAAINRQPILTENVDGVYVRADQFVYRLSPGEPAEVQLYATQYGELQDGAQIVVTYDPSQLQGLPEGDPPVAVPQDGVTGYDPKTPITATGGRAVLTLTAATFEKPPRAYIDGQVYGIRPLPQAVFAGAPGAWTDPADFISILVWNPYAVTGEPTWYGGIDEIFTQYGNLYPLMDRVVDLTSYQSVAAHADILSFAFSLPVSDPNSMPVTRDLSPAKREVILRWLKNRGQDGLPLQGTLPAEPAAAPAAETVDVAAAAEAPVAAKTPAVAPEIAGNALFLIKSGLEPQE